MSYDQGNQGSRRDFNDDLTNDTLTGDQRSVPGGTDSPFSDSHGGSGTGQAGGYTGNESRVGRQDQEALHQSDEFCNTDSVTDGNRRVEDIQEVNAPGVGQTGGVYDSAYGQNTDGDRGSRGYERDTDEFDDSGLGSGPGAGAGTGRGPTGKLSSMGSKLRGGAEKLAGKLSNDPSLEARGEQRKSGY